MTLTVLSRRRFLGSGAFAVGTLAATAAGAKTGHGKIAKRNPAPHLTVPARPALAERQVSLINAHTNETLQVVYWRDGKYVPGALHQANHVLRDHMSGQSHAMDPKLFDLLHNLHQAVGGDPTYEVISGYRSPKTNAWMHRTQRGVAAHSLHVKGKAVDVYLPGTDLATLHNAALALGAGGVGYYPRSGFVHVDTGAVRQWGMEG